LEEALDLSSDRLLNDDILFIIIFGGILVLFIYITRLASNEIFSPSNKIHREVGRLGTYQHPGTLRGHSTVFNLVTLIISVTRSALLNCLFFHFLHPPVVTSCMGSNALFYPVLGYLTAGKNLPL